VADGRIAAGDLCRPARLIAASLALSFGFVAGARRDVFGYSLSALYAGSALAYSGGSLPIEGAPTVARFWHQVLPFTHYLTAQMDQFLGAPARRPGARRCC
jgi:ABC-2 type transport system permease protein